MNLETLFTAPEGFGISTATPVQRAICKVHDGLPLGSLADDEEVCGAFGGREGLALRPDVAPAELLVLAGIRSGKSLLAAASAIAATQTCEVSHLGPGETPRVSVVSLSLDLGRVISDHIVGNVLAKPALRVLLVDEPTADSIVLRHPSGRPVEIKIVAGARAGASLVSRWSAGFIADEFTRMQGADDAVVNYDDCRNAVLGRLLPGAKVLAIGSPWAPFGPAYDAVQEHYGRPSKNVVIVRASGPAMNPVYWTSERCEELRERDHRVYRVDVLGEFADPESSLFTDEQIKAATRADPLELPPANGQHYVAAMDPATRGNAWTFVILHRDDDGGVVVDVAREWKPRTGQPLQPDDVLRECAEICRPYGISTVISDQWSADAIKAIAVQHGLYLDPVAITAPMKVRQFDDMSTHLCGGRVELPPNPVLRSDLLSVKRRVTQAGIAIHLPRTSDGRHCDFAPALALAMDAAPMTCGADDYFMSESGSRWDGFELEKGY